MYTGFEGEIKLGNNNRVYVRKVRETDTEAIKNFFESLSENSGRLFQPHPYTVEIINEHIAKVLRGEDLSYIALNDGEIVAYFFLWGINKAVPLLGIGIADKWQNYKLGQQFMDILIEDGKKLGRDGIKLTTMLDNDRAFNVYLKKGFKYLGDIISVLPKGEIKERSMFLALKDGAKFD